MKKRQAFTLFETMIALVIVGILTVISIYATKESVSYRKQYAHAYNLLSKISNDKYKEFKTALLYNDSSKAWYEKGKLNETAPSSSLLDQKYWNYFEGLTKSAREYPGWLLGDDVANNALMDGVGTDEKFCNSFVKDLSTINKSKECQSFITNNEKNADNGDFLKKFCAIGTFEKEVVDPITKAKTTEVEYRCENADGSGELLPSFILPSGQKFYISQLTYIQYTDAYGSIWRAPVRFVAVDLNGNKGPNSSAFVLKVLGYNNGNPYYCSSGSCEVSRVKPDIVLFALTAEGGVVPLGLPEVNPSYIQATAIYEDPAGAIPGIESKTTTLRRAVVNAWQLANNSKVGGDFYYIKYDPKNPFTYSGMIYSGMDKPDTDHLSRLIMLQFGGSDTNAGEQMSSAMTTVEARDAELNNCKASPERCRVVIKED